MKITESQLRRIIREEIIKESDGFEIPADMQSMSESERQKSVVMAVLGTNYPKAEKRIDLSEEGSVYSLSHLSRLTPAKMEQYLDAMVVHGTLDEMGPDIDYNVVLRKLPLIRKSLAGVSILDAHETNRKSLLSAMEAAGLFGRKSDQLRAPADRFYNPFRM